jgi:hypothetical protein
LMLRNGEDDNFRQPISVVIPVIRRHPPLCISLLSFSGTSAPVPLPYNDSRPTLYEPAQLLDR